MIVDNPEITLKEEESRFPEGARETAMAGWVFTGNVLGDDGRQYGIECTSMLMKEAWGNCDMWIMGVSGEKGKVVQPAGSVYRVADFPTDLMTDWHIYPHDSLTVKRTKNQITVDLGDFHLICKPDDQTWRFIAEDKKREIKAEFVHTGVGFPRWFYDKKKPEAWTPHSIACGYCHTGITQGTLTIKGRKVKIKGVGYRERYYAVDACPAEAGGWHDCVYFYFDEMCGNLDEMKLSKHKVMSLNLIDEKRYFPTGSFKVEHRDWAYLRQIGAFIPTHYKVTMETEAGVLEMTANAVGCHSWGITGEMPDSPTTTLHWENLEGTFTYKDGHKRKLTNGLGGCTIRQWLPYPNVLTPGFSDSKGPEVTHLAQV